MRVVVVDVVDDELFELAPVLDGGQGCRVANGLLMASGTLERH